MTRIACLLLLAILITLFPGCSTPTPGSLITPARIEAVTAVGAYLAAKSAVAKGHHAELVQAKAALEVIAAADRVDLPAVVAALEAAGIGDLQSTEGALIVGVALSFTDLWADRFQPVLDSAQAKSAVRGILRGFDLALNAQQAKALAAGDDGTLTTLQARAVATRN